MTHNPNMTERARRAEALAERSYYALRAVLFQVLDGRVFERDACVTEARAALDSWEQHKADFGTLALNAEQEPSK